MKRFFFASVLGMLISSLAFGATEIRMTGMYTSSGLGVTGDHRLGNTCTVSTGGRTYCGLNASHLSFFADNTISLERLYQFALVYSDNNTGYFLKSDGDNTFSWAATTDTKWDGGATGLTAATGRTSLGLSSTDNVTVAGIDNTTTLVLTGAASCKYSINGAAWATANDNVSLNDNVALQNVASGAYSTAVSCTLNLGGVTDTWSRTTLAAVSDPVAPRMRGSSMSGGWR